VVAPAARFCARKAGALIEGGVTRPSESAQLAKDGASPVGEVALNASAMHGTDADRQPVVHIVVQPEEYSFGRLNAVTWMANPAAYYSALKLPKVRQALCANRLRELQTELPLIPCMTRTKSLLKARATSSSSAT